MIKEFIRRNIPQRIKEFINYSPLNHYIKKSYSQEGEDLMLDIMMKYKQKGTYVDIGAHHPFKFSNTFYFYLKGWSGICVDPIPGVKSLFEKYRPRDVFINKGIAKEKQTLQFYKMKDQALNTFSKEMMTSRVKSGFNLDLVIDVETDTLSSILKENLTSEAIDFMTIDVEGLEYEVLNSNDWSLFKPEFLIVHYKSESIDECINSGLGKLLFSKGYVLYAKSYNSVFFRLPV